MKDPDARDDLGTGGLIDLTIAVVWSSLLLVVVTAFLLSFRSVSLSVAASLESSSDVLAGKALADSVSRAEKISRCLNPEGASTRSGCVAVDPEDRARPLAPPEMFEGQNPRPLCWVVSPSEVGLGSNDSNDPRHLECWHLSAGSLSVWVFGSSGQNDDLLVPEFDEDTLLTSRVVDDGVVSVSWGCADGTSPDDALRTPGDCEAFEFGGWGGTDEGHVVSLLAVNVCKEDGCYEKRLHVGGGSL